LIQVSTTLRHLPPDGRRSHRISRTFSTSRSQYAVPTCGSLFTIAHRKSWVSPNGPLTCVSRGSRVPRTLETAIRGVVAAPRSGGPPVRQSTTGIPLLLTLPYRPTQPARSAFVSIADFSQPTLGGRRTLTRRQQIAKIVALDNAGGQVLQ